MTDAHRTDHLPGVLIIEPDVHYGGLGFFLECYIPVGFAHGFSVTTAVAQVEYTCTGLYDPGCEVGIAWDDPTLAIAWPVRQPILSDRDQHLPTLAAVQGFLPVYDDKSVSGATNP